ncbi:MAG: hypothetical protein CVU38_11560 [Chloroflexi bacterium HGW-Chloroflexi-1]|nr:MAG: hypothetical protein CVU38_11560 [Chloroflexi bacterium HGW-Chloroflexi-1]
MSYGEVFAGTFRTIWRHKRLWLFGLLGVLLVAIGNGVYMGSVFSWQGRWFRLMGETIDRPGGPDALAGQMLRDMVWLWVGLGVLAVAALASYAVNLVMRGATIDEAAIAWRGGRSETGRGLRAGLARAIHLFVIDLLWWAPGVLFIGGGYVLGILVFTVGIGASGQSRGGEPVFALFGVLGLLCCPFLLIVIYALFNGIFAPLMYQSAVAGRRELGAAIKEGWRLARGHLGPMFIFWLLILGVSLVWGLLLSIVILPLNLPWLGSWAGMMKDAMNGVSPSFTGFANLKSSAWVMAGAAQVLSTLLYASFIQTFNLTMYAEVYRRLTDTPSPDAFYSGAPVPAEPRLSGASGPALPSDLGLTVSDEPAPSATEEPNPYV